MRSKQKVLIISIVVVLALAIIGLTIGLVLVLTRTQTNSFVSLSYVAKEVDCTITANGKLIDAELGDENKVETTILLNNGKEVDSVSHRSGNSAGEYTFDFDNVQLPAGGWAEYHFNIQDDTALDQSKASRSLEAKFEVVGNHDYSNIAVEVDTLKDGVADESELTNKVLFATLTAPEDMTTDEVPNYEFVVRVMVADPMQDVNEFNMSLVMNIAYGITDEVGTWGEDTSSMTTFKNEIANAHSALWSSLTETTIEIDSPEKLKALAEYVNSYDKINSSGINAPSQYKKYAFRTNRPTFEDEIKYVTFILTKDIDLAGRDWTPIGYGAGEASTSNRSFSGIFDGNGHSIYNLFIDQSGASSAGVGLFGHVEAGIVKNLNLSGVTIRATKNVGGLVGYLGNPWPQAVDSKRLNFSGQVINCKIYNASINSIYKNADYSGDKCGGLVGMSALGQVSGCAIESVSIFADRDAGFIIGCINSGSRINLSRELIATGLYLANSSMSDDCIVRCNYSSRETGNESAHNYINSLDVGRVS